MWYKCLCLMPFHPIEVGAFVKKKREVIPWLTVIVPLGSALIIKLISVYTVNYTVSSLSSQNASLMLELGVILLPLLLWAVASYAFMTIMGGESTFKETLTTVVFSLSPYIITMPFLIVLSRALSYSESGFFHTLQVIVWLWVGLLVFVSFKESNNLTLKRALLFAVVIIVVMALILLVLFLALALIAQIFLFLQEVAYELSFFLS